MQTPLDLDQVHRSARMDTRCARRGKVMSESRSETKPKTWRSRLHFFLRNYSEARTGSRSYRPTVEEVNQWSLSLENLLSHKYGLAAYRIFLKSEFCEENLEFWLACEEFKRVQCPSKLASRARKIYEEFIKAESPKEINVDFHTKDAIARSLNAPPPTCFLKAQRKVFSLMENSSYPRFKESEIYKELCELARRKA
ncbi:regulator of G-protein signaling 2 [Brienomyrus brachyistius]|uniref:regulator of G-protein signaling 2 n=1 Tax=Brienomyrus brachyistius TaxID=42636 RepID=UPI0020B3B5B3|nr:regulator of G-protein signaling 2 [Brienomyrus brachyistius]